MGESKSKRNARRDDARSRERSSGLFAELEFISLSFHLDSKEFAENLEVVGGPHSNLSEGSIVRTAMRSESAYHGDSRRVTKPIAPRFMAREVSNGIQNRYEEIAELWGRREQQRNRGRYAKMIVAQIQAFEKGVIRWVDDAPDATRSQNRRKILFGSGQMRAIDDYGPTDNAGWDKGHGVIVAVKRPDGAWQAIVERRGPSVSRDEDGELIRVDVESVPLYEIPKFPNCLHEKVSSNTLTGR